MNLHRFSKKYLVVGIVLALLVLGGYIAFSKKPATPKRGFSPATNVLPASQATSSIVYQNTQYGFSFSLPESWKGYSIVTGSWQGFANTGPKGDTTVARGPLLSIRNPAWTAAKPYQDIPLMVFTLPQWDSLLRNEFAVSAAPIPPSLLGFNAAYVFALPPRYNYAFPAGYEEVTKILADKPLAPLPISGVPSANGKVLICGGLPNGSTQNITETTRLFINLPKDVYPDRARNLLFKTVNGNATAVWISNGGPYGEGFAAAPGCWSYYYEFNGTGEVDVSTKAAATGTPNYFVRFMVSASK